jgi:hypothetical protein
MIPQPVSRRVTSLLGQGLLTQQIARDDVASFTDGSFATLIRAA